MRESEGSTARRYLVFLLVAGLHAAFIAALLLTSATRGPVERAPPPVQLLSLPPTEIPKLRSESFRPKHLNGDALASLAPPRLSVGSSSAPMSGSDGVGSGVDWSAEARRALQAFEIRSSSPPGNHFNSGLPSDERWWPRTRHRAGERFKTPAGDWIVWLNSNCYQVASAAAPAMLSPETTCVDAREPADTEDTHSPSHARAAGNE